MSRKRHSPGPRGKPHLIDAAERAPGQIAFHAGVGVVALRRIDVIGGVARRELPVFCRRIEIRRVPRSR